MKLQLYAVQDTKVGAFMPPFVARARGEALRSFMSACQDEKHQFFAHKADYLLFYLGDFLDDTGALDPCTQAVRVIGGDEF